MKLQTFPRTILPICAVAAMLLLGKTPCPARQVVAAEPAIANEAIKNFRAACVKVDITPDKPQWLQGYAPRQSEGVHDKIYHRIVAMDDGKTQFYLVVTDVCTVTPSFCDDVCKELEDQAGIKAGQVWWSTTHTHSAPELGPMGVAKLFTGTLGDRFSHQPNSEYSTWAKDVLIEGIKRARSQLQPARLGIGTGTSMANVNRRGRGADGKIVLGGDPDGPVDRQGGLI
ncbi:MAG: neutral/alkaline non-lysosomal ceramidase N-terminal domain-containing protein, partial [Pirellulales bacterium]